MCSLGTRYTVSMAHPRALLTSTRAQGELEPPRQPQSRSLACGLNEGGDAARPTIVPNIPELTGRQREARKFSQPPGYLVAEPGCQLRPCPEAGPSTSPAATLPFREAFPSSFVWTFRYPWLLKPKERKADFRDQVWRCKASSEPSSSPTSIFLPGLLFPKAATLVTSVYRASFLPCVPGMEKGFLPSVMTRSLQNRLLIGPVWVTHPLWCSKPWLLH